MLIITTVYVSLQAYLPLPQPVGVQLLSQANVQRVLVQMVWFFAVLVTIALGAEVFGALIVIVLIKISNINIYIVICTGIISAIFSLLILLKYRGKDIYAMVMSPF